MKQLFQKPFFPRIFTWNLRNLHSYNGRVTQRVLREDVGLGTSAKLVNSNAANFIKNCPLPFTNPSLFQKTNFCFINKSDVYSDVHYSNPSFQVLLPGIPLQRIQELIFPVQSPSLGTTRW
ncbi:hypothetical protein ACROYT_G022574 [Oculina patagonica]